MKKLLLCATAAMAVLPYHVSATETEEDSAKQESIKFDEIVVTAQRRAQSYLDVPASVSVIDSTTLQQNNVNGAADYLTLTPNVSFREGGRGGSRNIQIAIRGISDLRSGERVSANTAFGIYWDEFSVATAASGTANPPIYDVEAVEVLRGPQGTYFGRNAEGGALNIRTKKPTEEFYGQIDLGVGSNNTYETSGVLNLPVTGGMYLRTVVNHERSDGPVKNVHPTGGNGGYELISTRSTLRVMPTENTTIDAQVAYTREEQDYQPMVPTCVNPTFGFDPSDPAVLGGIGCHPDHDGNMPEGFENAPVNRDKIYVNTPAFADNVTKLYLLNATHQWDGVAATSVTGYLDTEMDQLMDLDHSGVDSVDRKYDYTTSSFSQEFRLASTGDNVVDWTVGGLYYKDKLKAHNEILIKGFLGPWLRGDKANENTINIEREGWAVFADAAWHVTDDLTVTLGGRYSDDKDDQWWEDVFAACGRRAPGDPLAEGCQLSPEQASGALPIFTDDNGNQAITGGRSPQTQGTSAGNSSDDFSFRAAVNYHLNDNVTAYAVVSQGYKAATARVNPDSGGNNTTFANKEKLTNYEVGFKGTLFDNSVRFELAAFLMKWRDMQIDIRESLCELPNGSLVPNDGSVPAEDCKIVPRDSIANAPKAEAKGLELSVQSYLTDNFLIGGTLGLLDAKYVEFEPVGIALSSDDLSGQRLPGAPDYTATFMAQYNYHAFQGDGYIRGEWYFRGGQASNLTELQTGFPADFEGYNVLNLRTGLDWQNVSLSLNVENVLKNSYHTATDGFSYGGTLIDVHPRTVFLRLTLISE
ncbi:TonB-dependent receptor [Luteithermobacter gelatinilyticus]|uniref:TonB-dependent receptor n=1 Tax=Luteithermobacter gelatinilyticus TaxID=2582913 RepID=UPI001106136D|nr:TonB-dependent receptor [Luteithermobacter gelatinilyticus]